MAKQPRTATENTEQEAAAAAAPEAGAQAPAADAERQADDQQEPAAPKAIADDQAARATYVVQWELEHNGRRYDYPDTIKLTDQEREAFGASQVLRKLA